MSAQEVSWQTIARAKLDSINDSIPKPWRLSAIPSTAEQCDVTEYIRGFLSQSERDITENDAVDILACLSNGEWKATDVTNAFCHRASIAHQLTSCLHETFFATALEDAEKLDEYFEQNKRPIGPLHGLPISLKDQFHVKGTETCMGYIGWIGTFEGKKGTGKEKVFESEMVKELRDLGAVLYWETVNNIIGSTLNPRNRNLSSGGSSGGEGALIGLRGSPLGFGTDIGGSIRIPAAFNGLYGIRPSSGRLPYEGMANSMDGQNSVLSVVGPLSHSAASLRVVIKALLSRQPHLHDPLCIEMPWRDEQEKEIRNLIRSNSRLAFGILEHDGVVTPHPPVRRAIQIVKRTLEKLGHQLVAWDAPSHQRGTELCVKTWRFDGGKDIHAALGLSGEPIIPQVAMTYGRAPKEQMVGSDIAATIVAKRGYQKEYMEYWNGTANATATGRPVDALIMPAAPFAAARFERFLHYGYSTIVNTLDYTSCVIPVTHVAKTIDKADIDFKPLSDLDAQISEDYDPEIYEGTPVAVQIVGRRLQEEKILALAEYIGNAIHAS